MKKSLEIQSNVAESAVNSKLLKQDYTKYFYLIYSTYISEHNKLLNEKSAY